MLIYLLLMQLMQVLKDISIEIDGIKFQFDSNGNPNIGYNVIQWVWVDYNVELQNVGSFLQNLSIDKSLFIWYTDDSMVRCKNIFSHGINQ